MSPRLPIVVVLTLGLTPAASAQPLDPVAPASAVVIVGHPVADQDEPRIVLARADDPAPDPAPKAEPGSPPAAAKEDPFAKLKVVVPKDKLLPVRAVRATAGKTGKSTGEKKNISVTVGSSPSGASVHYGGKNLGATPLGLSAPEGSTPINIVLRARGRMTLRTRVSRDKSRSYYYKLHPAKFR
jgi:hypothetical protein